MTGGFLASPLAFSVAFSRLFIEDRFPEELLRFLVWMNFFGLKEVSSLSPAPDEAFLEKPADPYLWKSSFKEKALKFLSLFFVWMLFPS